MGLKILGAMKAKKYMT